MSNNEQDPQKAKQSKTVTFGANATSAPRCSPERKAVIQTLLNKAWEHCEWRAHADEIAEPPNNTIQSLLDAGHEIPPDLVLAVTATVEYARLDVERLCKNGLISYYKPYQAQNEDLTKRFNKALTNEGLDVNECLNLLKEKLDIHAKASKSKASGSKASGSK